MAKQNYNDNRASLAQMLKEDTTPTPIQEVRPVARKSTEAEVKLNFFVPTELAKQIKRYAVDYDTSIKDVSIAAYRLYFEQMSKGVNK